ncbi:MFS transporter [Arthrobacter bussei]|uniref:MFS transporter n=1 Tax=Arthrobacter bussei TaxID=2594179 RepID=A0A7X1NQ34_9MICC|nr:MFS transporter [Arthrobacter bussei]MPY10745.1 MFS transporter [Arthrobacter bussei]
MLSVLRRPAYRNLFTAQVVALLGTGLLTVALGLLAFDLAGGQAGAVLGTALTIKMIAYVFVAPVMAALVERLPRKGVLVGADLVRAAIALSLPFIDQVWQIYVLVFILQSASATFTPAFQALIPVVLPGEKEYTKALSLSRLAYDLESLVSPLLAAALLAVMSFHNLFVGTMIGFLVSAAMVLATRLPAIPASHSQGSLLHRTTLGTRIFLREPSLRGLMALNLVVATATALVLVNTVVFARDLFGGSNTDVAIALAFYGVGSMMVAFLAPRVLERTPGRTFMLTGGWILIAGLIAAAFLASTEQSSIHLTDNSWAIFLGLWVLLGIGTSMISTPSSRLLRRVATDDTRSYLFTAQFSLSHACFLLAYPLAGWVGAAAGQETVALVLAACALIATIAAVVLWPATGPDGPQERVGPRARIGSTLPVAEAEGEGSVEAAHGGSADEAKPARRSTERGQ